jgi:hypothetical protein
MDHSRDLTHDVDFERLRADMPARGVHVAEPSDLPHDKWFVRALTFPRSLGSVTDRAAAIA